MHHTLFQFSSSRCNPGFAEWTTMWILIRWLGMNTGPRSAVGNVSGYRCVSDCRSRGREFDPGPVPYFRGDWSWNNFYGHSPPFRWFIQEGLLSVTRESMCTKLLVNRLLKPAQEKSVVKWIDRPAMTIAVDMGRKATKTNKTKTKSKLTCIHSVFNKIHSIIKKYYRYSIQPI